MTIYDATERGPVIALIGENRSYAIGETAYRFSRQKPGMTLPMFAGGTPVVFLEGKWVESKTAKSVIKNWSDQITVVDS